MTDEELRERAEKAEAGLEQAVNVDRIKTAELTRLREVINEGDLKMMMTLLAQRDALLAALERARQHLVMNEWVDDEGARRRFAAVKETESAIARAEEDAEQVPNALTAISNAEGSLT